MATPKVGIQLELMGGEEALATVERLERELKSLAGSAYRIKVKSDIKNLKKELDRIEADKIKIKVETKSAEANIKRLERNAKRLQKILSTKKNMQGRLMNPSQLRKVESALRGINKELDQTRAKKINLGSQFRSLENQAKAARQQISLTREALQNVKPIGQIFTSATSKVSHLGSAFQSLGSAMNRVYQPVRWLLNGTVFAAGYKLMNMAHEGLSSSLERYDTMENYAKSMAALGEDASRKFVIGTGKAMTAVENLNEAVLGLPTGLNEIVDMQKRFYSASNDMVKSTKMAIATNNAFLASGTEASERLFGERQLRNLLSVGKLTSMQWQSLIRTMPLAMDVVAKELGYADKGVNAMTQDINSGKLAVDDFMDAFVRLGTSGTIADAANVMKHSWQGVTANIQNAFSRMGYNILKTFDEIFQAAYGKDTIDMMYSFRDVIDKASEGIQNWIKSDPDFFIDTIERIKAFDWKGLAKGFGEGLKTAIDWLLKIGEAVSKLGAERVGKFFALSGMIANGLTIIGGALRGGRFAFGAGAVGFVLAFRALLGGGMGAKAIGKLKSIFTGLTGLGKSAKAAEKATGAKGVGGIKANLAKWSKPLIGIGSVLAIIAATAGTIALSTKAIKSSLSDMKEISSLFYEIDWGVIAKVFTGFGVVVGAMTGLGKIIGKNPVAAGYTALGTAIAGGITTMIAGFARLDIKLVKDSIKDMVSITNYAEKLAENVKKLKDTKFDMSSVTNLVSQLYGVYQAMFNTSGTSLSELKPRKTKKPKEAIKSIKDIFSTIKDIASMLPEMYTAMDRANIQGAETQGRGATPFTNFKIQLQGLFSGLNDIMTSLNEDFLNGDFTVKKLGNFDEIMASVKSMFGSIKGLLTMLPDIYESLNQMGMNGGGGKGKSGGATMFEQLIANLKTMFRGLGEIYTVVNETMNGGMFNAVDFASKLENIANGIESIRKIGNKLNTLGGEGGALATADSPAFTAISNIKTLINKLSTALGDADLGGLKTKIDTFVNSVKSLLNQLNALGENGTNTVNVEITIEGTVTENVTAKIKAKMKDIKNACKDVHLTKNVYIKIQRHVSVGGDSIPDSFWHTGGYIGNGATQYRAKGGSMFKPKGTDTVPAMLTPGEYVTKKSAVDFWGVRFMQKINNLDVNGALRELSARASHYMNVNRGTTINNNTTNNTDFTQNVYTSNPNFAFKRSSRYVGAL